MPILFKFVNRFDVYLQAKTVIEKIRDRTGVIEYNLFGYWGGTGIGKTMLLEAIYSFLHLSGNSNYLKYDCKAKNSYDELFDFLNQNSQNPGIALIDHLDEFNSDPNLLKQSCDRFIRNNISLRVIFCASKLPDQIGKLLRPEQRLIVQIGSLNAKDSLLMLDQIFPDMKKEDKDFLNEYAVGYPQMIAIFCELIKKNHFQIKINDKKELIWTFLIELAKSLNLDLQNSTPNNIDIYLKRLSFLSLCDGISPEIGKQTIEFVAELLNDPHIKFISKITFDNFIQSIMANGIVIWKSPFYVFYQPLQLLFRKYMNSFEKNYSDKIYEWLDEQYSSKYSTSTGIEKGWNLLKSSFYHHQILPYTKSVIIRYFQNEIKKLEQDNNVDAVNLIKQEIESSEIGQIFKLRSNDIIN